MLKRKLLFGLATTFLFMQTVITTNSTALAASTSSVSVTQSTTPKLTASQFISGCAPNHATDRV